MRSGTKFIRAIFAGLTVSVLLLFPALAAQAVDTAGIDPVFTAPHQVSPVAPSPAPSEAPAAVAPTSPSPSEAPAAKSQQAKTPETEATKAKTLLSSPALKITTDQASVEPEKNLTGTIDGLLADRPDWSEQWLLDI